MEGVGLGARTPGCLTESRCPAPPTRPAPIPKSPAPPARRVRAHSWGAAHVRGGAGRGGLNPVPREGPRLSHPGGGRGPGLHPLPPRVPGARKWLEPLVFLRRIRLLGGEGGTHDTRAGAAGRE